MRVDQPGQVDVGEHEVGGACGRPGDSAPPADAHPDVGEPDRRGVVHAVAGHRQRRPGPAQRGDQRHLLLRATAGRTPPSPAPSRTRSASDARANCAPVTTRSASGMPASRGDRGRRLGVVAGRDEHPHARRRAAARPRPRTTAAHACRPAPTSPRSVRSVRRLVEVVRARRRPRGPRPRAPAGPSPASCCTRSRASPASVHRLEHDLGRALHHQPAVAQRRRRTRGRRRRAGTPRRRRRRRPALGGRLGDGPVGLVRLLVAVAAARPRPARSSSSSSGSPSAQRHEPDHPQPVLRQRAGLVEADGVHPAQRLQHPGAAHDGAAAGQPPGGGLLGDRRDQRQPLGHGGDRDRHARTRPPPRSGRRHSTPTARRPRRRRPGSAAAPSGSARPAAPARRPGGAAPPAARGRPPGLRSRRRRRRRRPGRGRPRPSCPSKQHAGPVGDARRPASPAPSLATASDSPVRPDSSTSRSAASSSRASAATTSPDSTQTTSPTRSAPRRARPRGRRRRAPGLAVGHDLLLQQQRLQRRLGPQPLEPADQRVARRSTLPTSTASVASPSIAVAAAPVAEHRGERVGQLGGDRAGVRTGPATPDDAAARRPPPGRGAERRRRAGAGAPVRAVGEPAQHLVGVERVPRRVHRWRRARAGRRAAAADHAPHDHGDTRSPSCPGAVALRWP